MSSQYIQQFKKQPLEKRLEMTTNILRKYHDRCIIMISKKDGNNVSQIDKKKFICPRDINLAQFTYIIRKKIASLKKEQTIFVMINDRMFPSTMMMGEIYDQNKENDGFMYAIYCCENTFG